MDIFYLPRQVALDASGTPRAGAKLQFYKFGTTTPQDVFTTTARDVAHSNPVVADSEGYFPAIYLGTDFDYKAVLSTSADVVLWTQDNIANAQVLGSLIKAGTIPTAALADEAVTLDKMADVTRGSILVGGASNRPVELDISDDGKVLMGDGTDGVMVTLPLPTDHRSGCTLSLNSSDSDHDIDIAAGLVRDDTDTINIVCPAYTKRGDATFTAGTGNGFLSTGSLANSTNYYIFAIAKASGADPDYLLHTTTDPIGDGDMPTDYIYSAILNNGVPLLTNSSGNWINAMNGRYDSGTQTITAAGSLALTHPFGVRPFHISLWLRCSTSEYGYSSGDEIRIPFGYRSDIVAGNLGIIVSTTGFDIRYGSGNLLYYINHTNGNVQALTPANWTLIVRAEI